jgi:peroxiredoxin
LADYRDHWDEIRAAGGNVVAVSVDPPARSQSVRRGLHLPFLILCDTEKRLIQDWDLYNPGEKGGIAKPAVFLIGSDRAVRYRSVDTVTTRVPASEVVRMLTSPADAAEQVRHKVYIPRLGDWARAIANGRR